MNRILLLLTCVLALFWQVNAQTSTLYLTTSGGSYATEKWVSITDGPNGTGTVIWAQGNGTYGDGQGLVTDQAFTVTDGTTYYINCYDRYADGWDGTTYEIRSATGGGGILVANNGGVSPNDGTDNDATSSWETPVDELEVSEAFSYTPPSCPDPSALGASNITATSADLGWTAGGSETSWNLAILPTGASAPTAGFGTQSNPFSVTGLTPSTTYDYYVQANCNPANIMITGAYDGPLTGGVPKGVELYVVNNISDLSYYGLGSANNGGGTDGEEFTFPSVAVSAGTFIYVTTDSAGFYDFFGFNADYIDGSMSINGDDAVELFEDGVVIDVFGDINVDGTGTAWEYMDGWAYRNNGESANGGTFDDTNWTYSGINATDGCTTNATCGSVFPTGSFTAPTSDLSAWVGPYSFTTLASCPVPTGLSDSAVTTNSATVYWNAGGSETSWEVEYGTTGFTQGTGTAVVVTDSVASLSGLTANTTYDVYVRAICGTGDTSVWTAVNSFTTLISCPVPTGLSDSAVT
ncbi:MAG: fibronectin type III domain-containing protein, partial [Bacteroidetes bacterium]|nr:fibronectin type III domain-containing protein [Bacteroidota bacterium]